MFKLLGFPDVISILNGVFGFSAIFLMIIDFSMSFQLKFHIAFSLILFGLLADGLDGILARRIGKGQLGIYFEAMSDMTTMGIAPSVFIAITSTSQYQNTAFFSLILWLTLLLYICCAFIRLASFHPLKSKNVYLGLPASAATIFLLSIILLVDSFFIIILVIFFAAILMILPISFPKPTRSMNIITVIIILFTISLGFFLKEIYIILLLSVFLYLIGGQFYLHFSKENNENR